MDRKYQVCFVSILITLVLALLKFKVGQFTGNIPIKADALHSFLDMMTTSLVLISLYLSSKQFKNEILKGFTKIFEIFVLISIITLTGYLSLSLIQDNISYNSSFSGNIGVILISIISIISSHFLYKYQRKIANEENSILIFTDALETKMDQLTSGFVLISVITVIFNLQIENTFVLLILGLIFFNISLWFLELLSLTTKKIKLSAFNPSGQKNRTIIAAIITVIIYFSSGIYILRPGQLAVVQYSGKHILSIGQLPGLNYSLPWPISSKQILNIDEIKRIEIKNSGDKNLRYYITKDENLIDVSIAIQYKISNVVRYYFHSQELTRIIEDMVETATTEVIGKFDIDDALVHQKQLVLNQIKDNLHQSISRFNLGILILNVQFKKNHPPSEVMNAFNAVSSAREDKRTYIDNAHEYKNKILPEARGIAFKQIQQAEAFYKEVIYNSQGDLNRMEKIYKEYIKHPFSYKTKEFLKLMTIIGEFSQIKIIDSRTFKSKQLRIYSK